MNRIGFDSRKYIQLQSTRIRERIDFFGGKLYLEFGGKLFDDYHASRVLPGFQPDNKIRMLLELRDQAEIVIAINANDIEKNKVRSDRALRRGHRADAVHRPARRGPVQGAAGGHGAKGLPALPHT